MTTPTAEDLNFARELAEGLGLPIEAPRFAGKLTACAEALSAARSRGFSEAKTAVLGLEQTFTNRAFAMQILDLKPEGK